MQRSRDLSGRRQRGLRRPEEDAGRLAERLDAGLSERLGYECLTYLRTAEELREIAAAEPFGAVTEGKMHVTFLKALPDAATAERALWHATADDRLAFGRPELFWLTPGGIKDAAIDLVALEKLVGTWTMRTKGTVERFASKHFH